MDKRYRQVEQPIYTIKKRKKRAKVMTGPEFKILRENLNLTQEDMGRALGGYTKRAVAGWERGDNDLPPAVNKLIKILIYNPKFIRNAAGH